MSIFYLFPSFLIAISLFSSEISIFSGLAYDDDYQLIFKEEYRVEKENDKILNVTTKFFSPTGEPIAEMSSLFSDATFLPTIAFSKKGKSFKYGTNLLEKSIELFKTTSSQLLKKKTLRIKENMVAGHGFYFYILSKIDSLLKGEKSQMVFLQPNRLGAYTFNMKASKDSSAPDAVKVQLSIDNSLLKKFVPDIELVINQKTKALISYKGLSGFLADDKSLKKISVKYTEPKIEMPLEPLIALPFEDARVNQCLESESTFHAPSS